MSHPLHELQAPLGPNVLPEQTDTPVSWRQGEVLHLELFFSHSRFSASLENVAILIVRCHWSHDHFLLYGFNLFYHRGFLVSLWV